MTKISYYSAFLMLILINSFSVQAQVSSVRGDVNQDGKVNISDVTSLIDYLLSGVWSDELNDEHEWVDLGLPSGTLWATCNLGANAPEEYGDYFAWGETTPKDYYDWNTYIWCKKALDKMTKYCTNSNFGYNGFTDGESELASEDDAAYVNWGSSWRIPSTEQQQELVDNCTWTWTMQNGINGRLGIGPNGNTIFLPAAGDRWEGALRNAGTQGHYWSRTLDSYWCDSACSLYCYPGFIDWGEKSRAIGQTVRAVREL